MGAAQRETHKRRGGGTAGGSDYTISPMGDWNGCTAQHAGAMWLLSMLRCTGPLHSKTSTLQHVRMGQQVHA